MTPFLRLVEQLSTARRLLIFTGAGISTGSGIPDFRGPKGLWTKFQPVYYQDFISSHEARVEHWTYKLTGWKEFREARPNAGHRALVELDESGIVSAVVTQNIDGLHQLAGHSDEMVVELHGTNRKIECCTCGQRDEPDPYFDRFEATREPPLCGCGGFLKPATISFGQAMPIDKMEAALQAAERSDMVLAIGSTLEVHPAASVPVRAQQTGSFYAILNMGPTAHDEIADLKIDGDASEILVAAVAKLGGLPKP